MIIFKTVAKSCDPLADLWFDDSLNKLTNDFYLPHTHRSLYKWRSLLTSSLADIFLAWKRFWPEINSTHLDDELIGRFSPEKCVISG